MSQLSYKDFEPYYHEYKDKIFNFLFYRCGQNTALAEDLTSEVFIKAFEKFSSYDPSRSFKSWLYTIAHNHLIDYFRKKKSLVDVNALENVLETDMDAKDLTIKTIASEQVQKLLESLGEEEKSIVLMRYIDGYSMKQIAEVVGREEGNIRVIIHRAMAKLKKYYTSIYAVLAFFLLLSL